MLSFLWDDAYKRTLAANINVFEELFKYTLTNSEQATKTKIFSFTIVGLTLSGVTKRFAERQSDCHQLDCLRQ